MDEPELKQVIIQVSGEVGCPSPSDSDVSEVMKELDANGDGKLSEEELIEGYSQIMGIDAAKEEVQFIMKEVDLDGSGYVDYTEFITAAINK